MQGLLFNAILLVIGFVLLIKGADFLIDSAVGIARMMNIPTIVIGLTIVAFGTSAPEAAISIQSALNHQAELAIGNVLGSNILNVFLILGMTAAFQAIHVKRNTVRMELPFIILATVVFAVCGIVGNRISRLDGFILWGLLFVFMVYTMFQAKNGEAEESEEVKTRPMPVMIILLILGFFMLIFGSDMIVNNASAIAKTFGMSERLIGLTIVAFGTSLPELVASLTAVRKGNSDMAIGNVVGSNIFNLLFIAGTVSVISPLPFSKDFFFDLGVTLLAAILLFLFSFGNKQIDRKEGGFFLLCYVLYTAFLIMR